MKKQKKTGVIVTIGLVLLPAIVLSATPSLISVANARQLGEDLVTCGTTNTRFIGQSEALNKTSLAGIPISELSGLTYDLGLGTYYATSDRVSGSAPSRIFELDVPITSESLGVPIPVNVTTLNKADQTPSTGSDFDGEGIAISHQGHFYLASEGRSASGIVLFQSEVRQYAPDGSLIETLSVPDRYLISPAGQGTSNLSLESLALSPNGRSLFTANETPLTADGATNNREGRIRILRYEDRGPEGFLPAEQFFYLTDPARNANGPLEVGVVELIALSETDLMVLERGFVAGQGNTVRVYRVTTDSAADVSQEATLAEPDLTPLQKSLVVDLSTCPSGGATLPPGASQPNPLLDNFEGMTLGPVLPGGLRSLILISDDNTAVNQKTRVVALVVPQHDLVVQPEQ